MLGITWIAVRERTREFGTRRALGASAADIFLQVATESAALALFGCLAGVLVSFPLSQVITRMEGLPFVFSRNAAEIAFIAAAALNIGFSFVPSRRAASLNPTDALRYE
jgi:putative ABC transport system permease protein